MDSANPQAAGPGPLPYLLSLPDAAHAETTDTRTAHAAPARWPVLFFLHGSDEGPPTDMYDAVTRIGPLRPGNDDAGVSNFIVVAPQLPERGDFWPRHADAVRSTVRQVQALHAVDPARIYLTGFSFGARLAVRRRRGQAGHR
jgi:predicted peptidase